jgi:DNA excision repair protein ERCC-2
VLQELKDLIEYRQRYLDQPVPILALGLSSRKNLCVHPSVAGEIEGLREEMKREKGKGW